MSNLPPVQLSGGPKCLVSQDADLAGTITLGANCILHPRCVVYALNGPIVLGDNCIVEETAIILNRRSEPMVIGRSNLFEVGSRVESASVGDHNTFEAKARVSAFTRISDWCTIGAGCTLLPNVSSLGGQPTSSTLGDVSESDGTAPPPLSDACELLPIGTVVFGSESKRRAWSLEGQEQAAQLHEKHLGALRELFQRAFKARTVPPVASDVSPTEAPPPSTAPQGESG